MRGTFRVLAAEVYRLPRSRGAWLGLAFLIAVPALRVYAAALARARTVAERALEGRAAPAAPESGDAWAPFVEGWRVGLILAALLLLVHAARSLAADRESGVLRPAVTRGVTRSALVLGRALLAPLLILLAVAASGAGAWVVAERSFDFGPLVEDGYELLGSAELRSELSAAILSALTALLALYGFGLLLSTLGRSATGALSIALLLFLGFAPFKEVLADDAFWTFAAYVPFLADTSAMSEMTGLARGFSDAGFPPALARSGHIVCALQVVLLVALACISMRRRAI